MTGIFILCLCACAVLTSGRYYNQRSFNNYPEYGYNNNYNKQGYYDNYQPGYQRENHGSRGRVYRPRYRRSTYAQPSYQRRLPYQRFDRYGGQIDRYAYQPRYQNNGYNKQFRNTRQYNNW